MPQSALESGFPCRLLQKFALFSSALFPVVVHSELSPTLARVHPARILMYLYYRACFWEFVRDGMTLRIQRYQRLCPVFPDVRHLGVHSSSPLVCFLSPPPTHTQRCAHPRPGGKLRRYHLRQTGVGREVKSVKTTQSNARFVPVTKADLS
jgi:hypothetical protein